MTTHPRKPRTSKSACCYRQSPLGYAHATVSRPCHGLRQCCLVCVGVGCALVGASWLVLFAVRWVCGGGGRRRDGGRAAAEGRTLEGSGAFGRPRFCVDGSSLLASRGARPWQGRTLEGSGGSGARFWIPAVLRARVVTFGLEGRGTVAGRTLQGSGGSSTGFWTFAVLRGRVVTFGLEGARNRGRGVLQHTRTHTHQPTPTNTHAYTHMQDCMSNDWSPRAKTWTFGVLRSFH